MKKRLKTEAFLAVIFALICQILEMFVFKSGSLAFVMNFLTVIALGLAIMLGVRKQLLKKNFMMSHQKIVVNKCF